MIHHPAFDPLSFFVGGGGGRFSFYPCFGGRAKAFSLFFFFGGFFLSRALGGRGENVSLLGRSTNKSFKGVGGDVIWLLDGLCKGAPIFFVRGSVWLCTLVRAGASADFLVGRTAGGTVTSWRF